MVLRYVLPAYLLVLTFACGTAPHPPSVAAPASAPRSAIELVESVPVETTLDHADLRDAYVVWLAMIGAARATIDIAEFYVSNAPGSRLEPVIQALEAAAARGVRVRVLVERSFVKVYPETLDRLARAGAAIRHFDLKRATGGILHAKYFVVDGREAFCGSQNLDWRALEHIQELGARVGDPAIVGGLAAIFAHDWAFAGGEPDPGVAAPRASGALTLVASPRDRLPPGVQWDLLRLVGLIDGAQHAIRIQALSYRADANGAMWTEIEVPLLRAARRGVRVELLLADWSKRDKTIGGLQRLARVPGIEIRLATIPAWSGGFVPFARVIHSKLLVVDGRAGWLGTSNFERDYFYSSRNVGIVIEDRALAARLDAFFESGWTSRYAVRVDPDATYTAPRIAD